MRYIGSKQPVLKFLEGKFLSTCGSVEGKTVADLFAGTCSVSILFKRLGAKIIANDYMTYSFVLQNAFLKTNKEPKFKGLSKLGINNYLDVIGYLNNLPLAKGFFYMNYCIEGSATSSYVRNYFSKDNAKKIDAILKTLREWIEKGRITFEEDCVLRASLIDAVTKVSNISGTYGAFLKIDDKRKFKPLMLNPIIFVESSNKHDCYNDDIFNLIDKVEGDILYLDPPYNQRQYPPYYHILETLALDDNPNIYGKTGRRPYKDKLSPFCIKNKALQALKEIIYKARFRHIFLSYNTDGLLKLDDIKKIFNSMNNSQMFDFDHRRYKSNNNGVGKDLLKEVLFYGKKTNE